MTDNQICECGHKRKIHRILRCPVCGYTKKEIGDWVCNNCKAGMVRFNEDLYCYKKNCHCKKFKSQNPQQKGCGKDFIWKGYRIKCGKEQLVGFWIVKEFCPDCSGQEDGG